MNYNFLFVHKMYILYYTICFCVTYEYEALLEEKKEKKKVNLIYSDNINYVKAIKIK